MPLVPYKEDHQAIVDHIVNMRKGPIKTRANPPPAPPVIVKMVSPIQQQIEMNRAELADEKKEKNRRNKKKSNNTKPWNK